MSVSMLSTYGVSSATNAQVSTALANPPFTTEAQFQQLLVAALRNGQVDTIDSLLAAYFTQVVTPLVNQGLKDYTQMDAAVDSLLDWAHTVEAWAIAPTRKLRPISESICPFSPSSWSTRPRSCTSTARPTATWGTSVSSCWASAKLRYWVSTLAR